MTTDTNGLPVLLWVDLRINPAPCELESCLSSVCCIQRETQVTAIPTAIQAHLPQLLCFDYDYPDRRGLQALRETKRQYPSLPILMLTEQHSESLAIWAFRTGVRDYLIKPVTGEVLQEYVKLFTSLGTNDGEGPRCNRIPSPPIPADLCFGACLATRKRTSTAVAYVEANFHEKISLDGVACLCRMNSFQFSRAFHQEHGMTFREFLIQYRIDKARALLLNPRVSVAEVAWALGFGDPSYFTRLFHRYVGVCPNQFRFRHKPG